MLQRKLCLLTISTNRERTPVENGQKIWRVTLGRKEDSRNWKEWKEMLEVIMDGEIQNKLIL